MPGLLDDLWKINALLGPEAVHGHVEEYLDDTGAAAPAGKSPTRRVLSFLPLVLIVVFLLLLRDE